MEKKSKRSIIIGITTILLVALTLLGLTYAYYRTRIVENTAEKSLSVTSKKLEVTYQNESAFIEATDAVPGDSFTKTFEVKNTGDEKVSYSIMLDNVENTFARVSDWKFTLKERETVLKSGTVPKTTSYIYFSEEIASKETKNYSLTFSYENLTDVNQSIDMGKNLSLRINIGEETGATFKNATEGTLLASIGNNNIISDPLTSPANEINATWVDELEKVSTSSLCTDIEPWLIGDTAADALSGSWVSSYEDAVGKYVYDRCDHSLRYLESYDSATSTLTFGKITGESIISVAEDDDGTSYYYRGLVEDNYVTFAGMCWRIVRIDGNGNTKLILEDQDEVCSTTMDGNWDIEASDGTNITLNGTEPYRTGYFGSDNNLISYLNPVDNPNRAMVNAFKYFQTNTLTNKISEAYTGKTINDFLVSGNWCLNNKAYSDSTGTQVREDITSGPYYYDSYVRLYGKTTKEPTLKCPVETMETFGDNTTPMYVATLTADEIVYAGGIYNKNNPTYYLGNPYYYLKNFSYKAEYKGDFWTLSPSSGDPMDGEAFVVNNSGAMREDYLFSGSSFFRPAVSLSASTRIVAGGKGTISNPYVIS